MTLVIAGHRLSGGIAEVENGKAGAGESHLDLAQTPVPRAPTVWTAVPLDPDHSVEHLAE